jgi:flagellar basal-body rod modification protein FlgD
MFVNSVTSSASSAAPAPAAPVKTDFDAFLTLLVTEMKNQDPTKPIDPTQMVSQLASFSAVEQATKTNMLLQSMLTTSALGQAGALIGRHLATADGKVSGTVRSIAVGADGLTATLTSGVTLPLTSDMIVS